MTEPQPPVGDQEPGTAAERTAGDLPKETLASVRRSVRGNPGQRNSRRGQLSGETQFTGSGPDDRDPMLLGAGMDQFVKQQGWERRSAVGGVIGRWPAIAGADLAAHVVPESFDDDTGKLLLRAESTTWATQVRLLVPSLQAKLDAEVGVGIVKAIEVIGPGTPKRSPGRLRVPGRGPRDTYG